MGNKRMLNMQDILELVNVKMRYGADAFSRKVLRLLDETGNKHNIIKGEKMREYISKYIEREFNKLNNRKPETDKERDTIIKIEGSTKRTIYEEDGIIRMLADKRINQLLKNRLQI